MFRYFIKILPVFAVLCCLAVALISCDDAKPVQSAKNVDIRQKKDSLEKLNKLLVSKEKAAIKDYIINNNLDMIETGTGLCYCIVNKGNGDSVKTGDLVTMDYIMTLLNGEIIYSSEENGRKMFVVGHGGVESGLEEAVLHRHYGDEAEIVIPSHWAYGLTGDGNKIPINSTIVYKVKVVENQSNKLNN